MALTIGQTLRNQYLIIKLLYRGGFGLIYLALDTINNRFVVIKESNAEDHQVQNAILEEIKLLTRVHHEHLPQMYDYFQATNQRFCVVMEYIPGQNLDQINAAEPRPALPTALQWMRQVLAAVATLHAHAPPIVHRDVKLANIQIHDVTSNAYLLDFGIAKTGQHTLIPAYTPPFAPPEQYGQGATSPASDVYAVGVCLYMLLTGYRPPAAIDRSRHPLIAPRTLNSAIAPSVERVILRAMELDPEQRYLNGRMMLADFEAALDALDVADAEHDRASKLLALYRRLLVRRRRLMMRDKRQLRLYQRLLLRQRKRRREALNQYRQLKATYEALSAEDRQQIQELLATIERYEEQLAERDQRIHELAVTVETIERTRAANPLLIVWNQELFRWVGVALVGLGIAALIFQPQPYFASALQFTILIWGGYPVAWLFVTKVIGLLNRKYTLGFRSVEWTFLFLIYVILISICSFSVTDSLINGENRGSIAEFMIGVYCMVGLAIMTGLLCDFLQEKQQSTRVLLEDR